MRVRFSTTTEHRASRHSTADSAPVADSRLRMRHLTAGFAICLAVVFLRVVWLECSEGREYRAVAARPLEKTRPLPGVRGRLLSRDGVVLACDRRVASLAVHFRYLEDPPNARWLRAQARARVPRDAPHRAAKLAAEQVWLRDYRDKLLENLARMCGRPVEDLEGESRAIQKRVRAIADVVNRARANAKPDAIETLQPGRRALWQDVLADVPLWLFPSAEKRAAARIVVAEELDYHVLVADVPLEVVAEVESRPNQYPGARLVEQSRRQYPQGSLAGNVVGHLGAPQAIDETALLEGDPTESEGRQRNATDSRGQDRHPDGVKLVGRLGAERQLEASLRGRDGLMVDLTDRSGRWLSSYRRSEPAGGGDVVLTLDARLQRIAEERLDRAVLHSARGQSVAEAAGSGGAIVVLDIHTGAMLAAATAPRFNPNHFASHDSDAIERSLHDPAHPLYDRVTKMAIPPGSVFKVVTALALLAESDFNPDEPVDCQGFLVQPDRQRCQIFRRYGVGHGPTTLSDALVRSCNVYFFQHANRFGPRGLVDWAARLGFGRPTGVDLPGESSGSLPSPDQRWTPADTQALAIGQSTLTTTPLQIARLMATVANDGRLLTPYVVAGRVSGEMAVPGDGPSFEPHSGSRPAPVAGLGKRQLDVVRQALRRVVDDPEGTAYITLADVGVAVAGKTGTAETGDKSADHAWFAGYAPADGPRVAFAVVLEHRGSADQAAAVAKELIQALEALGMLAGPTAGGLAVDAKN